MAQSHLAKWYSGRTFWLGRQRIKYTQTEAARFLGRQYEAYSNLEKGKIFPAVGDCYALADLFKLSDEVKEYLVAIARNGAEQNFQTDRRFNALCLQMAEQFYGSIFKWDPLFIPGIAQTRAYHFKILREAEGTNDEQLNRGWSFKMERIRALLSRKDRPKVVLLISETALLNLRFLSEADRREQLDRLRELDARAGWQIKIVSALHPEAGGAFSIYRPAKSQAGGPPFAYAEVWDNSWCIENLARIARYDDLWQILLGKSITLKEYLDDRRDGLAQEHSERQ
ncbi:helix-turn-helix transcriptional regulator [Glycomyces sp. A-F 0318]|uniref:Scr1 family TA system antitoxin-like transcriptional regulator n=1 Tax=Glycomyces amatae TaxID=2881355 RepID=UPI001E5B6940|nr:Scr1 family TA system antitoxin-like transcriptional regulator [Glycomyces amatae]MCD0442257.1 helix-turn-helix transcriptional regulator [Glycomyces amatae]